MTQPSFSTPNSGLRVFSASLLSALLIVMPFVQLAAASGRSSAVASRVPEKKQQAESKRQQSAAAVENVFLNAPVPKPAPEPVAPLAPVIVATKTDNVLLTSTVNPGDTISYTVNIANNGAASPADDATGVQFTDTIDSHTTLVPGSPIAVGSDKYNTIGNVQITVPDGATDLLGNDFDPDTGNNTGMTVTAETKSSTNCTGGCSNNVTINANGSFTYDPPLGFTGTDTFTYTAISGSSSLTATVTITVANEIWFINSDPAACTSNCDGRLSHPFKTLAAFNAVNDGAAGHPGDNDWIFLFESATDYAGPATLRNGQKFIGQDATASLATLTTFPAPSGTDPLPVMNSGNGTFVNITGANVNGINLLSGNTLRGFRVGNVGTGTKISGTSFGTLVVGNSGSPDVLLNGTGRALSLTTGTLSVTGGFVSVTTSSSASQGISLSGVADSDGAGGSSFNFGSTTLVSTSEGILVSGSTADLNFGNTSVTGGTDGISLQNNSAGTRTFGTLGISGNSGIGFRHFDPDGGGAMVGGGAVNVTGATTITNPTGNGIDIQNSNANLSFAATTVNKNATGNIGVNLVNNATRTIGFTSLTSTTTTGFALLTNNSGTVNSGGGSLTQSGAGGGAASLTNTALSLTFTSVSSNGGANGLIFSGGTGSFTSGTTNLQNNAGIGLLMSSSAVVANFGNTTVNSSAGDAVDLSSNTGTITFADLDLTPDAGLRGFDAQNNTGTITSTSGDISTTNGAAVFIDGPAGRTPLAMVLNNVDDAGGAGADNGVNLTDISGTFTVNDATLATNIQNTTGTGIVVNNSTATVNFGNTNVTGSGNANGDDTGTGVFLTNNAGAITFADLDIAPDSGERAFHATDTDGATAAGAITLTSGTISTTNDIAVEIVGATSGARTPLNIQFTTINVTGGATAAMGIVLQNTSTTGAPGGFNVLGTGGTCTFTTPTCSGGRITNTSGADNNVNAGIGVKLTDVNSVSLTRMRIDSHPNFALRGHGVNGFTLQNVVIDGNNGTSGTADTDIVNGEDSLRIINLTGSALIDDSYIGGGYEQNVRVVNDTGTLNRLTISDSKIGDLDDAGAGRGVDNTNGDDNINIEARTAGTVMNVTLTGNTLNNARGDVIQTNGALGTTMDVVFRGNAVSNNHPNKVVAGGGATFQANGAVTYDISCNSFRDSFGIGLNVFKGRPGNGQGAGGTWSGTIFNNRIGVTGVANSGAADGASGINVEAQGNGVHTTLIKNNIVLNHGESGIRTNVIDANTTLPNTVTMNATVIGNTVAEPDNPNGFAGFFAVQGAVPVADANTTLNLRLGHFTVAGEKNNLNDGQAFTNDVFLQRAAGAIGAFNLSRAGSASGTASGVVVDDNIVNAASVFTDAGIVLVAGNPTTPAAINETCTPPASPPIALNMPAPGDQRELVARVENTFQSTSTNSLSSFFNPSEVVTRFGNSYQVSTPQTAPASVGVQPLATAVTIPVVENAFASHLTAEPARQTTAATSPKLRDQLPEANTAEVRRQRSEASAHHVVNSKPETRSARSDEETGLRAHYATLSKLGTRNSKLTTAAAPMSGETVTANIGTLPAGGSVTITFQVTVNNPPNLTLLTPNPRVENQGTVTANGGISVNTDDPETGTAGDKTATRIDLFDTTTSLVSNLNPSNFGDLVTFTATVNETPVQGSADPAGTVDFIDTSNGNAVICNDVAVTAGSAQCITSALAAGTHDMQAVYSGDGNFEGSTSNIVSQVVIACAVNPIVTTNADSGAGSLRQAITDACNGTTIDFAIDPGAGPHTITLTTGELVLNKNLTIQNTSGESVTVSGGNASRVFNINSGKTATISNLTITGGDAGTNGAVRTDGGTVNLINVTVSGNLGGGIFTDASGSVTVINSTISGNSAPGGGAAIYCDNTSTLNVTNSTISGNNTPGSGGGIATYNGCTATITNATITNNVADSEPDGNGTGGGIFNGSGTVTLHNTIVAGNLNEDGVTDSRDDVNGALQAASSFNLIGDGTGMTGISNGDANSNQVGSGVTPIDAGLGLLANNGGPTMTHALSPTSPAVETGSNTVATNAGLTTDQRGTGFPRIADSADADTTATVDIGAFELHPSVEDITDKLTAEDTGFNFNFNIGDDTGALITSVTATSGNTTLIPNANLIVTGSGGTRNLAITPALNANSPADGTATITVTVTATNGQTAVDTFVVTVTDVNDAPVPTNDTIADIGEDCSSGCTSGKYVIPFATLLANDTNKGAANESGQTVNITAVSAPTGGTVAINGTDVEFTPTADFSGPAGFTYTVTDNGTTNGVNDFKTGNATVSFNITAVNDNPTLATNTGITVAEGSTGNIITSAMLSVTDPDNTAAQLTYTIGTAPANGTLKKSGGALAGGGTFTQADINGNLITYDHDGSNTTSDSFTFTVSDGAGGSIGLTTFNITITAADDAPTVTAGGTLNYTEGDAATAIDTTITVTDTDSANLVSATAQITGNYVNGEDVLSFTDTATITGIFNPGSGTLTLTGSDTVANYQAALRAVKYNNTSENPSTSARTVSWIVNDGSLPSSAVTSTINVTAVNDPPVNTVPGPQGTNPNTALVFSSGSGNQISVADVDAGTADIRITLTATNGTLTLATTSGLNFACGGCAGDGTADATMTFEGTLTEVNTAMNGMSFTPTLGFSGAASVTITSNDLGNTGTGGAQTDTDVVNIQVATNVSIQDAKVAEPASGSVNMVFTVTLNAPAPAGGASVNFQTSDGTATDGIGEANQDYTATSGTVNFAVGEQLKTINVPVLSDADNAEVDETFTVTLSSPVNATIADGTATGTITVANPAGTLLISEFRQFGPGAGNDPLDDFVEIYNNTDSPITVPVGGYGLFKMGALCTDTPQLIGTIPAGTVIPARGHFLFTGPIANYSLKDYGGTNAAAGNALLTADLGANENFGLFATANVSQISSVNRFDAVGFGANNQNTCDLLREGSTLAPLTVSPSLGQHSYFRKMCEWIQGQGCTVPGVPKDTNQNSDDFWLADTAGSAITGRLGAPGPENLGSPIRRDNAGINMVVLDGTVGSSAGPNRERNGTAVPNGTFGTMTLRYRVTNNTGASVTRLRYRVVDISTAIAPAGPTADLRALTSSIESVGPVGDSVTCTAGAAGAPPCTVTVQATTLETPPAQAIGGGYNSTLSSGTITTGTPLLNGNSILINFKLGVEKTGTFRFYIIIEALP